MDLLEHYNSILRTTEDDTLALLNRVLDQAFNRLVRRIRFQIKAGAIDPAQRNLALLQEFRQLIPTYRPDRVDAYDRLLRRLLTSATEHGITVATDLTAQMSPERDRLDVSIPLDAVVAAASRAKGYLRQHGETFATTAAEVVAQGIAEGRPTDAMIRDMRTRLGVVKSRAETIVRTEALSAYGEASNHYYAAQGVDRVMWYATSDDRTCDVCAPRAGLVYQRGNVTTPCHPRCRCYLAPWSERTAAMNQAYVQQGKKHREEVLRHYSVLSSTPIDLSKAAVFETAAPTPADSVPIK